MSGCRSRFFTGVSVLAIVSCAQRAPESAADPLPLEKKSQDVSVVAKKKPRMNGRGKVTSISLTDAFDLQQSGKAFIYDARPGFFYGLGRIPGAINLPKAKCDEQITAREEEIKTALADGKTIIVYCSNFACPDARTVATHLASFGYSSSTLSGGWDSWKESGLPTE